MKIGFKKVHPDAILPKYAHEGDAGMDVCAVENVALKPYTPTLVKTGLVADIPTGYEIQVRPRSGMALKRAITVLNSPGTIDSGYRGEIGIILFWCPPLENAFAKGSDDNLYIDDYCRGTVVQGERIAQLVVAPVTNCEPVEIEEVSESERGAGGFGSTGV